MFSHLKLAKIDHKERRGSLSDYYLSYILLIFVVIIFSFLAVDGLNSEQQAMYEVARNFATNELEPGMKIWDEEVCYRLILVY